MKSGYSLVELVVVMAVLALLMVGVGSTLFGTLRGARKADIAAKARSEGAYAQGILEQKIKFARKIETCSGIALTILDSTEEAVALSYDAVDKKLAVGSTSITSDEVAVTPNADCQDVFACDSAKTIVTICFDVDDSLGSGLTSHQARVNFKTQVFLRNANLQ